MKKFYKFMLIVSVIVLLFSYNAVYASMADFTD